MKNLIDLATAAHNHIMDVAPRNIVSGYQKYVLTNGTMCIFVERDHSPSPGEAVFECIILNGNISVELHRHESMQAKRPMNLTISEEVRGMLAAKSEETGLSMSAIVEMAVKAWLN